MKVALPLESTVEVISLKRGEICPIPGVAPALLGVVNQGGRLLWVLDLSDLLKLEPSRGQSVLRSNLSRSQERLSLLTIAGNSATSPREKAEHQIGCLVSALKGIVSLNPAQFKPVPATVPSSIREFVSGITEIDSSPVAILNSNAIFAALQASVPTTSLIHQ